MNLFDDIRRCDPSPALAGEDSFSFLNRVEGDFWEDIRLLIEEWFERYPRDHADELRKAFRSAGPGQHWAAWWELYLHEYFSRLGYAITVHPALPDSSKRPDFELTRDDRRLYVEASVLFSGITPSDRRNETPPWLIDAINTVRNGNFFAHIVGVESAGPQPLKVRDIARPLREWLDGLDPDDVIREQEEGRGFPQLPIAPRDWEIVFEAWPVSEKNRGRPDHRVFGAGPVVAGWANDIEQLKSKLKSKAGRYGRPDIPFVTAVLCQSISIDTLDIEQALFGREAYEISMTDTPQSHPFRRRDGFWIRRDGPQNQRVSAVITATGLHYGTVGEAVPRLWLNPFANHALEEDWPLPTSTATVTGGIVHGTEPPDPLGVFNLPQVWPRGERFPRADAAESP